jgi:group I intron endonuclease
MLFSLDKENSKLKGIYKIVNLINGKSYIGLTTISFIDRYRSHNKRLKKNNHVNCYLQNSYNKYGSDNFEFSVIEVLNTDDIEIFKEKEILNIKNFKGLGVTLYNQTLGGDSNKYSKVVYMYKIVYNFNKVVFKFIKKYNKIKDVAEDLNYRKNHIHDVISAKTNPKKLKDYIFLNEDEKLKSKNITDTLLNKYLMREEKTKQRRKNGIQKQSKALKKRIYLFDLNDNFICLFNGVQECLSYFSNISKKHIMESLYNKNQRFTVVFKFEKDFDDINQYKIKNNPVRINKDIYKPLIDVFDLDLNYIKTFKSTSDCAKYLKCETGHISRALKLKQGRIVKSHIVRPFLKNKIHKPLKRFESQKKKVAVFDLNDNLINQFNSIAECSNVLNVGKTSISNCINGKIESAKNLKFKRVYG